MFFDRIMSAIGSSSLLLIVGIYFLSFGVAQAQCNFFTGWTDNKDGTVTDTRNGLIWKRCSEGYIFEKGGCKGTGVEVNWEAAQLMADASDYLGENDWRLPSKEEFEAVLGENEECEKNKYGDFAASVAIVHAGGWYWTSSAYELDSNHAWDVNLANGRISHDNQNGSYYVRLVRAGQILGGKAALEFVNERSTNENRSRAEVSNKLRAMSKEDVCEAYGTALREGNVEGLDSLPDLVKLVKKELARRKLKLDDSLVRKEHINIGVSECQLFASWGLSSDQNRSVGSWGVHTQHVYSSGNYVYTENGRVTSWQN